ncbi:MAG: type I methionyl aminopeptidase [Gammaproteobacteria bacterium]|jgi:methionyl aminopeptidase
MAIQLKSAEDLAKMRVAGDLTRRVLDMIGDHVAPGVTTGELDRICHAYIVNDLDAIPAPLNYRGFPKSICTSVNHVVCHGIPGDKKLKKGDIINIDVTVIKEGFHGDASRMFAVGEPSVLGQRLIDVTKESLRRGIAAVRPGGHLGDIGAVIQEYAESEGFSIVREYCGHGIGRGFHEDPQILHYGTRGQGQEIMPGMTFTIEPMINAGRAQTRLLSDGWTVVTKDHSLSAQWEHTLAVTNDRVEILTGDLP